MDIVGTESAEEEISESFVCCVCLDLLYKPIVLSCGHISCFWCVHGSMNSLCDSHCPICRNRYHHFPTICQMLHFLLQKMYPLAYKRRELQILEEEKERGSFSPQLDDANACSSAAKKELHHHGKSTFEEASANSEQLETSSQVKPCTATCEKQSDIKDQVTGTLSDKNINSSQNQISGFRGLITVEDVLCAGCKELLFRPAVLNCGHAYCESCLIHDEMIRCKVCQSLHPKGIPKVSLELSQFLEEHFPKEYACRKDTVRLKDVNFKGLKEADKQEDKVQVLGDHEASVHVGIGCDFCGMFPIIGDRYKCKDCVEKVGFDLCGDCYRTTSKLPGRFNQQHTPEHKFELIQFATFHEIFSRFRATTGHIMDGNTALAISHYSSEDSEDGSTPLSLTGSSQENVDSMAPPDSSPAMEQDQDDSRPTS